MNGDTGKAIQIGGDGIENQDYLYYGYYNDHPVKWRVLDAKSTNTGMRGVFLLSEYLLDRTIQYSKNVSVNERTNIWEKSDARIWCGNFEQSAFTPGEQAAILPTTTTCDNPLTNDKLFFLSYAEASQTSYGFKNSYRDDVSRIAYYDESKSEAGSWWLRTSWTEGKQNTGVVNDDGLVCHFPVTTKGDTRPAFNLNSDDICLISSIDLGGPGDTSDPAVLDKVPDYGGTGSKGEWKLTLKDDKRNGFQAKTDGITSALNGYTDWKLDVSYSGAQSGDNEYVYAMLCDNQDVVLYYADIARGSTSGKQTVWIPAGLEPGKYTLKIFSAQWNGYMRTGYAGNFVDILLEVQNKQIPKNPKPNAVFEASDAAQGTLSSITADMKYSVDGGNTWKDIAGESMEITDVTEDLDIRVYQPGDGFNIADSEIQTIDVTQAKRPEGPEGIACTTESQNDGRITGVYASMEYMPAMFDGTVRPGESSITSAWIPVEGSEIEGLPAGTYYVRVKAGGTVLASPAQAITVAEYKEEHTCAGVGDWYGNETYHWRFCICGAKVDEGKHIGGTASCMTEAECDICKKPYGGSGEHSYGEWIEESPADCAGEGILGHYHCSLCGTDFDGEKRVLGTLTIFRDSNRHTGGTEIRGSKEAKCVEEGYTGDTYCTGCGEELAKGNVIPATGHVFGEWKVTEEATADRTGKKERVCTVCGYVENAEIPITSGEDESKRDDPEPEAPKPEQPKPEAPEPEQPKPEFPGYGQSTLKATKQESPEQQAEQPEMEETAVKKPETPKQKETVAEKTDSPKTGDTAETVFWFALLFLSSVMIIGSICLRWRVGR